MVSAFVTEGAPGNTSKVVPGNSGTWKKSNSGTAPSLAAPVISIATMQDLIDYLDRPPAEQTGGKAYAGILPRMRDYQAEYCVL